MVLLDPTSIHINMFSTSARQALIAVLAKKYISMKTSMRRHATWAYVFPVLRPTLGLVCMASYPDMSM